MRPLRRREQQDQERQTHEANRHRRRPVQKQHLDRETGTAQSREALLSTLSASRDERAGPLWGYILSNIDHRGPLQPVYVRAIESLGTLRAPEGVGPLKDALYRGEWYAPGRTRMLRSAAAAALARISTPEAVAVLEEAASSGPRNVRAIAREHLANVRTRSQPRRS